MVESIPVALHFSRYRAFKDEVRIPLAPLTLILGKNGSGKSVLTRLPVLLASGMDASATSPLNLVAGGVSHASRYEDLVHQRSAQPFMLGAEIAVEDVSIVFKTTLRHVVESHSLAYERFEILENGATIMRLEIASPEEIGKGNAEFRLMVSDAQEKLCKVEFAGLFPSQIDGEPDLLERVVLIARASGGLSATRLISGHSGQRRVRLEEFPARCASFGATRRGRSRHPWRR